MTIAGLFLLVCLLLVGCGGGGATSTVESKFQGLYQGGWSETALNGDLLRSGETALSISDSGNITGTFSLDGSPGRSGSLQGKVLPSGSITFTVTYVDGSEQFFGNLTLSGEKLTGPFGQPTVLYSGHMPEFDLTRYTL